MNYSGKFDANFSADVSSPHSFGHFNVDTVRASHVPSDAIIVPNAHLLFNGDYKKSGLDLVLSKDGQELVLHDYFKGENRAPLASPDGAHLTGDLVNALSGHVQYAQADGSAAAAKVIGHVTKLEGSATCLRNGVAIILNNGDNVEKGDVVQTGTHATLGITFIDGTVFGLLSNSRMVLNEMVYDPNGSNNSSLLSLVAGTITFVAGETAKHGDMKVDTPVATMGIRGTAVLTEIDFQIPLPPVDTDLNLSALPPPVLKCQVLVEPDGTTGSYILYDKVTLTQYAVVDKAGQQVNISSGQVNYSSEPLPPDVQKLIQDVFSLKFSDSSNTKTTVVQNDSIVPNGLSGLHSPDGSVQLPTFANLNNGTNGNGLQNNLTSTFFVPFQVNATTATENTTITTIGGTGDSLAWQVSKDGQTGWVTVSTAQNFTPSEDQEGMFLQLVVTGATPQTIGFGVVQENPAENAAISLSGLNASHNAVEGATVTATVTEPDAPSSDLITYTWLVDGKVVASGAGMNTFTPGDSAGGKTLTVTVSFIDTHNFAETGTTSAGTVVPIASVPVVTASVAPTNENSTSTLALTLTNASALFADGDDSVTITVTLDQGAKLTQTGTGAKVVDNGDGTFTVTATSTADLAGLAIVPSGEFEGTVNVGVSAVAHDGSSTSIAGTTSATLTVNPVAEPASLAGTITSVSGDSDTFIPLTIVVTPVDADDQISIKITGVPSDAKLTNAQGQAYQANADGSYTLTLAQLSGLKFLADEEDQTVLHVVVTSSEDGVSATSSVDIAVSVDSVLTIAAGDTLHINGDTLTDHTVNVFGTLIGFGTVTGSGSPPSLDNINIGPQGLIEASSSHTVILHGNVTGTDNGNSTLELTNNTSMEIGGSVASNVKVLFDIGQGAIGTLILDDPKDFHATITGSGTGNLITSSDIIDLKGLAYSGSPITLDSSHLSATVGAESISLSMNPTQTVITVSENGTMAMIKLAGDYTSHSFTFSSDGHLGTQFTDPLAIYSGGSLELSSASTDTVLFVNDSTISGTLVLDNPAGFTGQISGFTGTSATSDAIDLKGLAFDSAMQWVYTENRAGTGGSLTISEGSTTVDTLNFAGNYTTANFNVQSDGNGGTLVTDPPAKNGGAVSAVIMNDPGPSTNDTVVASAPNQTLTGLAASDTFVFNFAGVGNTTVTDFHPLTDILQFRSSLFATAQEILNATHDDGHGNTVIAVDGHDTVTLDGVVKAQLHTSDFHIA